MKILLVEDEKELGKSLARILTQEGYEVKLCHDGNEGLNLALTQNYNLLILDWMLPNKTGLEICQGLKSHINQSIATTPVLFLTAKDTLDDRVIGLDAGADDYLIKPFELRELLARVRALLRRLSVNIEPQPNKIKLEVADLEIELENQLAYRNGRLIKLSEKEVKLLEFFSLNLNQLVTQEEIFEYLWSEEESPSSNVVAAMVRLLRRKIEKDNEPILIHTIYGKGYWFGLQSDG
ncbi:DNA-binding heavy metal response regulator [Geminocystis sp. NIES-3708]|uniref:response regulator transcription factor n=1 Tax=Geminocystis sp. NIES-3708 TaxID=1615909 RepID=UPI0005FC6084|nr:response regulator transcription factor [Geminocystis sp. NIES-3708]BAQ62190.1 DNA-binding heavy metal response regulator [Geminocystis sp. NIES-3708]